MAPPTSVFMPVDVALGQEIAALQASGSRITDFNTGSIARDLFEAVAVVVSNNTATADQLQLDSYLDTATGDALDALGANWMVDRKPAVQATGQVTITRQSTSGSLTIPAGWGQLVTSPTVPGVLGTAVLTTEDADFANTVATAVVNAQAVIGGTAGNLSSGTFLIPISPVNGVSSQNGFEVTTAFTNGVDAESDDAYRARIPIAVQGRVLGRRASFLAAALGTPGVLSAAVLGAGDTRADSSTVPAGSVEVYYQGSDTLLTQVTTAVENAAYFTQNPTAFAVVDLSSPQGPQRVVFTATVYMLPGGNATAIGAAAQAAAIAYFNGSGCGGTAYYSGAVEALLAVPGVVTVGLPLTAMHKFGGSSAANIATTGDQYLNLAAADTTITVTSL